MNFAFSQIFFFSNLSETLPHFLPPYCSREQRSRSLVAMTTEHIVARQQHAWSSDSSPRRGANIPHPTHRRVLIDPHSIVPCSPLSSGPSSPDSIRGNGSDRQTHSRSRSLSPKRRNLPFSRTEFSTYRSTRVRQPWTPIWPLLMAETEKEEEGKLREEEEEEEEEGEGEELTNRISCWRLRD